MRSLASLRSTALVAVLVALLSACAPGVEFGATFRSGSPPRAEAHASATLRVTLRGSVRVVVLPAERPPRGVTVQPTSGRAFSIPPGHYPPPGACRAWVPGVPPGRQSPPGPCPAIERDLPSNAYLIVG
jgi:hypothetical protein